MVWFAMRSFVFSFALGYVVARSLALHHFAVAIIATAPTVDGLIVHGVDGLS
jgi:hypothetical protein